MPISYILTFLVLFAYPIAGDKGLNQSALAISTEMFETSKSIEKIEYRMVKKERIDDEFLIQESIVKLSFHPFQVYINQRAPKEGLEILYSEGAHNDKALINPNGFPWITLKLDPMGSVMRYNQHHNIFNSGYKHVVSILEFLFSKYEKDLPTMLSLLQPVEWQGHTCHALMFENNNFKFIEYQIDRKESLLAMCDRLKISEHMVLELNEDLDDFDEEFEPGQKIKIPNDYSPKMIIYIDQVRMIPLMMKVFDERGIYELYEYYDVVVDPIFNSETFSSENEDYNF